MTTTTWECTRCWGTPITSGLLCAGCVKDMGDIVDARHTPNSPQSGHNADLAARHLAQHREWIEKGTVPEGVGM